MRRNKAAAFIISIVALLVMFFSIPWSYPAGIYILFVSVCAPLPKAIIDATQLLVVYVIARTVWGVMVWEPVDVFLPLILSAVAFLIWRLSMRHIQASKIYLWIVVVFGLLAAIADVLSFHNLLQQPRFFRPSLIFVGHAIFVVWVTYYYWRLIRKSGSISSTERR